MSDPTFNSVKISQDTIGAVGDLLTIDAVGTSDGNGAALSFINNSAVEGLHFVLGRISTRRVDATTVRMDLAVANDPTISSGDDTPPALSLLHSAGGLSVATPASSTLAVGGALSVSGTTSMSGTLNVGGAAILASVLNVGGAATIAGALNVGGAATLAGTLDVNGAAVLGGTLNVGGATSMSGTLNVVGAANLAGALNVGGAATLAGTLNVGGAIIPAAGNADTVGIRFPNDPGGGAGDQAWLRYYARAGEATTLEIGVANDSDDHIALMPSGNVGVGVPDPTAKLHVNGNLRLNGPLTLPNSEGALVSLTGQKFDNESTLQKNNLKLVMGGSGFVHRPLSYEFAIGHTVLHLRSGVVIGGKLDPGAIFGFSTSFSKVFSINQNGDAYFAGGKTGYVVDHFVNRVGDTLEQGDVVVISQHQSSIFTGADNNIPLPEVDLTDQAYDKRVCGIVARVSTENDLPLVEPHPDQLVAPDTPLDEANRQPYVHPLIQYAAPADAARTAVQAQQIGAMVTLGAFAHCKVDADIAPIEVGDLLTTSPTRGHAQKVLAPECATGAIIAKALAPLAAGKGKIPVMVLLQ